jgi:hypothetical protein
VFDANSDFKSEYGNVLNRARNKHERSIREQNYTGEVSFEKTAYGKMKVREVEFLEQNMRNKSFTEISGYGNDGDNLQYLTYNSGPYRTAEYDYFSDVEPAEDDFSKYDLGKKEYIDISNKELQSAYDNVTKISKQKEYEETYQRLKRAEDEENSKLSNRIGDATRRFTDKLKRILK